METFEGFLARQRRRVDGKLGELERRLKVPVLQELLDTPAGELVLTARGHAQGHDAGPDWRERNL